MLDSNKKYLLSFGAGMYSDYTIHKDEARQQRYISRHQKDEDFNKSGIYTSGFWAKHLLWKKKTSTESIDDVNKRFSYSCKTYYTHICHQNDSGIDIYDHTFMAVVF